MPRVPRAPTALFWRRPGQSQAIFCCIACGRRDYADVTPANSIRWNAAPLPVERARRRLVEAGGTQASHTRSEINPRKMLKESRGAGRRFDEGVSHEFQRRVDRRPIRGTTKTDTHRFRHGAFGRKRITGDDADTLAAHVADESRAGPRVR